jgi:glycine betaine/proline transport system ATP-binding protein
MTDLSKASPEQETLIEISGLYQVFGNKAASVLPMVKAGKSKDEVLAETGHTVGLRDINLDVKRGEIFVIMGLSGSGKSTMIRHFNRLIDPTEGQIKVEGNDIMKLSDKELIQFRRHKMSMVFQHFGLMPHRTVLDNVAYGLAIQKVDKATRLADANQWLETVGLGGYGDQYPSQLSGGQQQRVGLARALCTNAEILLMDEAFSALDPLIRSEMQDQLIELQAKLKKTIIFITHDLDEALRIGDRIAILKDGILSQVGKPVDILLNPADAYVEAFVKDVNRARALNTETLMQKTTNTLAPQSVSSAIESLTTSQQDYGFVINNDGYQGVVTRTLLEKADNADADICSDEFLIKVPSVSPSQSLQSAIPEALSHGFALPVTCEEGKLVGTIERSEIAQVLES